MSIKPKTRVRKTIATQLPSIRPAKVFQQLVDDLKKEGHPKEYNKFNYKTLKHDIPIEMTPPSPIKSPLQFLKFILMPAGSHSHWTTPKI